MKKLLGTVVLGIGLIVGLFAASVVYRWVSGGYGVQVVPYADFVGGHEQLSGSYLKLTGARIDTKRIVHTASQAELDPESGQVVVYGDVVDRYIAPLVGVSSDEAGAVVEISGGADHDALMAEIAGWGGGRYMPIELEGLAVSGELSKPVSLAVTQMGIDPRDLAVFDSGIRPVEIHRRILLVLLASFLIIIGFELRSGPRTRVEPGGSGV